MQWLLGGLAALVQVIVTFFIGFVTKKTAQIIAALGLAAAVSGALIVALGYGISTIVAAAPTGWVAFGIGLLPYNTPACIAAVIGGNLARWLYDWQTRVIAYSLNIMAVYFFTGKLGSGKTLCAVGRIRDYLREGRRVATNLDLNLSALSKKRKDYKWDVTRLPDKPRLQDMKELGRGCEVENEQKYGLIVLDELGTWFNSRKWQDKERLPLIDWFLHARKHHWDIIFIVQDIDAIDAQLRGALCEHLVTCRRLDRLPVPLVGSLLKLFELPSKMPKIHVATVRYGESDSAPVVHRWVYSGKDLYSVYDTAQVFSDQLEIIKSTGELADMRTSYTLLSPYHLNGCRRLENAQTELINAQTYFKSRTTVAKPVRPARAAGRPYGIIAFSSLASLLLGAASVYAVGRVSMGDVAPSATVAKTPDSKSPIIKKETTPEPPESALDIAITTNVLRTRGIISNGSDIYATIDIYNKKNELISKLDLKHVQAAGWAVSKNALGLTLYNGIKTVRVPLV